MSGSIICPRCRSRFAFADWVRAGSCCIVCTGHATSEAALAELRRWLSRKETR